LAGIGNYVSVLDRRSIDCLLEVSRREGPVVVKTHTKLTPLLREYLERGEMKATFSHRDPRDMILASMDHHARSREKGEPVLEQYTSVQGGVAETRRWCRMACKWVESDLACVFRYADLVKTPEQQLVRLCSHLHIPANRTTIRQVLQAERGQRARGRNQFNKGLPTRYVAEMNPAEIALCNRKLGRYMRRLGYPVEHRDESLWSRVKSALRYRQAA
jgi:hypothetical protein